MTPLATQNPTRQSVPSSPVQQLSQAVAQDQTSYYKEMYKNLEWFGENFGSNQSGTVALNDKYAVQKQSDGSLRFTRENTTIATLTSDGKFTPTKAYKNPVDSYFLSFANNLITSSRTQSSQQFAATSQASQQSIFSQLLTKLVEALTRYLESRSQSRERQQEASPEQEQPQEQQELQLE